MINFRPHITEKTVTLAKQGQFTLSVPKTMSKGKIVTEIRKIYKVKPEDIRTQNEKSIRSRKMRGGVTTNRGNKKAVIVLKKGESIPGFDIAHDDKKTENEKVKKAKTKE